jgi:hypothetical protein
MGHNTPFFFKMYRWLLWGYPLVCVMASLPGWIFYETEKQLWRWMLVQSLETLHLVLFLSLLHLLQCQAVNFGWTAYLEDEEVETRIKKKRKRIHKHRRALGHWPPKPNRKVAAVAVINPDNTSFLVPHVGKRVHLRRR